MNKKEELIEIFKYVLYDAQDMYLSEYSCSQEDSTERKKEDEETLQYFLKLLEEVINE